ncbi:MAG: 50S ribosomal protein L15 [Patescibacteria group bacterium]|jgi:large subunit ribosomal protein L15
MSINLSNLKPSVGSRKKKVRVGRGNASGHGTFSGRGIKGQRARSGGRKKLQRRGLKQMLMQLPKSRGFQSQWSKYSVVNLVELAKHYKNGEKVTPENLIKVKLIKPKTLVKILGGGKLTLNLNVWANAFSKSAITAIEKAGGTVNKVIIPEALKPKRQAEKLKANK